MKSIFINNIKLHFTLIKPCDRLTDLAIYSTGRTDLKPLSEIDTNLYNEVLHQQYESEDHYLNNTYPNALKYFIVLDSSTIGRVIIEKAQLEWHIISLILLPEWRNKGIGSLLLQQIILDAKQVAANVHLNVYYHNTDAIRLYKRNGFIVISQNELSYEMAHLLQN